LDYQWIRACGGALPFLTNQKKTVYKFGEIKLNLEKCMKAGKCT
jgi:hypothetical protein